MLSFGEHKCSYPKTLWAVFAKWIFDRKDILNHSVCMFPSCCKIVKYLLTFVTSFIVITDLYLLWRRLKTTSVPNMKRIFPRLNWLPLTWGDLKIILQAILTEWSINMLLNLLTNNYDGLLFPLVALPIQFLFSIFAAYNSYQRYLSHPMIENYPVKFYIHTCRVFITLFQFTWLLCHLTKYFGSCIWV